MKSYSSIEPHDGPRLQKAGPDVEAKVIHRHSSASKARDSTFTYYVAFFALLTSAFVGIGGLWSWHQRSASRFSDSSRSSSMVGDDDYAYEVCDCPAVVQLPDCMNSSFPVLGGVDFVSYWSNGLSSDANDVGMAGQEEFFSTYMGYTFLFSSEENRDLFNDNPSKYAPQWGGFCGWAISSEFCPDFAWDASCLGPAGNWGIWDIVDDKIYFFYLQDAKDNFLANTTKYIEMGDRRWQRWYGEDAANSKISSQAFNTKCYHESAEGFDHATGQAAKMAMGDMVNIGPPSS